MTVEKPVEAFPLTWPFGRPRTEAHRRTWSQFKATFGKARDRCLGEIRMLGGKEAIVSSNLPLRLDGMPYASRGATFADSGVAVYFTYKGKPMCFACDRWAKVEDNMHAIALTIGALRGIARWGTGDMMEAAFTGFAALPAPGQTSAPGWRELFGFAPDEVVTRLRLDGAYRTARSEAHPDRPTGSALQFDIVQKAYEIATQEIGA